jgi:ATP-dependent Clp protease ATP-binding subunit ClpB
MVDFKNTVVIMTSNIGSLKILEAGGDRDKAVAAVESELLHALKPEFLNRIDNRIVFDALSREDMDRILDIQLARVRGLLANRDLKLEITPAARTALCDLGYDPAFGARPLKRAVTTHLLNPMSSASNAGGYEPNDTIRVDLQGSALTFSRLPAPPEPGSEPGADGPRADGAPLSLPG